MKKIIAQILTIVTLFTGIMIAYAEVHEVKMLNRGANGSMIFEPDYLEIASGDSVKFIAKHKSHNAASIPEMMPEGAEIFRGKIDEEIEVPFDIDGFYGIQCVPHYSMGMVMLIKVGEATMSGDFKSFRAPGKADDRFKKIIAEQDL